MNARRAFRIVAVTIAVTVVAALAFGFVPAAGVALIGCGYAAKVGVDD